MCFDFLRDVWEIGFDIQLLIDQRLLQAPTQLDAKANHDLFVDARSTDPMWTVPASTVYDRSAQYFARSNMGPVDSEERYCGLD